MSDDLEAKIQAAIENPQNLERWREPMRWARSAAKAAVTCCVCG